MHLADGLIPFNQSIIYWALTIVVILLYLFKSSKNEDRDKNLIITSFFVVITFIVSTIPIPSLFGIPIHFFVIPLVVLICGPLNGVVVSFLSLLLQYFTMAMGGIIVLGANTLVMGLILGFITYIFFKIFENINKPFAVFAGTLMGIIAATVSQVLILLLADVSTVQVMLSTLIPFYMFIAIIEGLANVLIYSFISKTKPGILEFSKI